MPHPLPETSLCVTGNRLDYHESLFFSMATSNESGPLVQGIGAASAGGLSLGKDERRGNATARTA